MESLNKAILIRNGNVIGTMGDKYFSTAPLGTVLSYAGQIAPYGYLLCDGTSYPTAEYPDLYAVIGNTYGGDDANFNVPDYRETVLVGAGENTTDTIASHDVYELGEFKDDQLQDHTHTIQTGVNTNGSYIRQAGTYAGAEYSTTSSTVRNGRKGTTTHGKQKGVTYIIKAFHTNEGTDSGVSDDVVEYVAGEIAEVETALPNIKKFANPSGTAKYITISGATLGDIEVHSAYAGKYMFTSTGAKPIFFGTSTYLGYTLTGWAWNSDKTKLYLRVNGHRDFVISAFGSDGVEISDMTTTAPTDVTFNATFNYNAYIDNSTSENTSTYSSAKIDKKFAPRHFGTDNKTLWLKLQLGAMTTHEPIIVTDQYGGQVKILGMYDLSTYKSVKVIRISYGDWSTHSGTDFTNTSSGDANYKIRRLFYCPDDNNYYLEIRQYSYISVEGAPDATMVTSLPVEESAMTLIPESAFASKSDLATQTANRQVKIFDNSTSSTEKWYKLFSNSANQSAIPFNIKLTAGRVDTTAMIEHMSGIYRDNKYKYTSMIVYRDITVYNQYLAAVYSCYIVVDANNDVYLHVGNYAKAIVEVDLLSIAIDGTERTPVEDYVYNTYEHRSTDGAYATKADLGSNVPMTEIAFTNSTNWSNSSGNLKTFYMVKNGWCFLHVVAHCNKVANDNNSVVYSGLPIPPFQVYGKFVGEDNTYEPCNLTIATNGQMLLRGGTAGKDYSFTYTYPVV